MIIIIVMIAFIIAYIFQTYTRACVKSHYGQHMYALPNIDIDNS